MVAVFFAYFALVSIVAGVLTVALKNPVHCGLALLALLLHVSGLFVLLNAEFLWAVQVIVYAGAILVLYLFVLMLLNLKTDERYTYSFSCCSLPMEVQRVMRPSSPCCKTEIRTRWASRCSATTSCSLKSSACFCWAPSSALSYSPKRRSRWMRGKTNP